MAAQVTVKGDQETGTLSFATDSDNPDDAVRIADAFANETVRYLAERQEEIRQDRQARAQEDVDRLEGEIEVLDQQVADQLAERNAAARAGRSGGPGRLDPDRPARRRHPRVQHRVRGVSGTALRRRRRPEPDDARTGAARPGTDRWVHRPADPGDAGADRGRHRGALGAALALLLERLDAKLRDRRKAEEAFGTPVVGELPSLNRKQRAARLVVGPDQHNTVAEAFRSLRTSVTFMAAGGQPLADDDRVGAVLVTSPSPAEGKTTVAVNLAAAFAETGRSVVLVNSDFRRPVASTVVAPDQRPPLPAGSPASTGSARPRS